MRIDFDKFNLSQKIYSTIGVLLAIITFMIPERYFLRISIGLILLTAIVVFFLKYNVLRKVFNIFVVFFILVSGGFIAHSLYISSHQKPSVENTTFPPNLPETKLQLIPMDYSYYAICTSKLMPDHEIYQDVIHKCSTQSECQEKALSCSAKGLISREVVQGNERLRKIFSELPIGDWYILYANKVELGKLIAEVYRVIPDAELDANCGEQFTTSRLEQFKEYCKKADCTFFGIRVISPNGKITHHNVTNSSIKEENF